MYKYRVLNIITGGLINDGITNAWLSFCKEFNNGQKCMPFIMDFAYIKENSSSDTNIYSSNIVNQFKKEGYSTPSLPSRFHTPIRYMIELYRVLKKGKYDIVHVNGSSSLIVLEIFVAWIARIKIRIAHSRNTTSKHKMLHTILRSPLNWLINGRLACGSEAGKWLFGNKEFDIIHNGKDLSKFSYNKTQRNEIRKKLGIENKFVVGHVGMFNNQKNHTYLIDIFELLLERLPDSILVLIGDGPLETHIKEIVKSKKLSDKVVFTGAVTNIQDFLQGMDIMVFPSKYEGLPNVVLEWQAMGIPSVISDKITNECVVSDFVKIVRLEDKITSWVEPILNIQKNYPDRNIKSEEGITALIENKFDIKNSVKDLLKVYDRLILKYS